MIVAQLRKSWFALAVSFYLASILCGSALAQTTIHVPADVPTISQAMDLAQNGDTVLVSPGTYIESIVFQGKAITLASTDGPTVTILDARNINSGPMFRNSEGPQSVLRGFTITNGFSLSEGAGVSIQGASPTIEGNIITGNYGCEGIGITADNSSAIIRNNVITNNMTLRCWGAGGGGIKVSGPGNAQILNNTITSNEVWGNGGGIELNATTIVTITGNIIQNNSATNNGGGISIENGSQATIANNLITANTGFRGTGIYLFFAGYQNVLVNNTIALNTSVADGQPVWMIGSQYGTQFFNNLIVDGAGNGAVGCDPNSAFGETFASNDILSTQPTTPPQTVPPFVGCPDFIGTNGNISLDPQFVNPAGNDYHLQSTSPVIDVGSNTAPDLPDKDLDGNGRIGPGNSSTCAGIVDMGAYEYALTSTGTAFLSPSQDFGTVAVGDSSRPQTLDAFVQGCVQVKSVTISGDFSQTNSCGHALSSSSNCTIQVTFTPVAAGQRIGSLNIDFGSSAPAVSTSLSGTGLVVPPSVSPTGLTFGNQVIGSTSAAQTVTVSGGGNQSLQISSVSITGDYAQTNSCVGPPVAAPMCFVNVTFAPITVGSRPGAMVINTNVGSFNATLDGTGIAPQPQFSPSILNFGNQLLNTTSAPQTVTLTNVGIGTLQILGFDDYDSEFKLTNNCGSFLDQGASCTITVTFTPTLVGNKVTGFDVVTNNGNPGVALRGTGVLPAAASLTPAALTFAGQLLNTASSAQVVTLSNTGGAPLLISSIAASGDFAQTNACAASLDPGTSCTINVTFTPSARGSRTGTLVVNSNSFGGTPTVSLSGTGQIIQATAAPAFLTFPLTAVNTTSDAQSVTLTNSGDLPVTIAGVITGLDYAQTNTCGASLDVGASCTISVTFTPSVAGADNDTLTISGNFGSPVVVALNGSGQAQGPSGTLSPAFLVFSNQFVGTTSPAQTLTYTSTGTDPVSINFVEISFGPFAQTNNCPASLAPGDSCTINVTFTPPDSTGQAGVLRVNGTGGGIAMLAGSSLPQLISPASLDFGHQAINSVSPIQTIALKNTTGSPIIVYGWSFPQPFNVVDHCTGTVAVGATCTFDATFAPTAPGSFSGFVEISGNFAGSPAVLPVVGKATGAAGAFAPASLTFASQVVGITSAPQTVTLTNKGAVTLKISSIQTTGDFAQTNNCPATLLPGASCTITTTFTPTDPGARSGTLSVTSNAAVAIAPVALSGTGAPPAIGVFSPQSLTFGSITVGQQSAAQAVMLTNTGTATLSIGIGISNDFAETNNCLQQMPAGSSCTINVVFEPTAPGSRSGMLTLSGNSTPPATPVTLSGTAVGPLASLSPISLTFASQSAGTTSAAQSITLSNAGNATLVINGLSVTGDFSETNNCGTSLAAGSDCTINVFFAPTADGPRSGVLSLSSDSSGLAPSANLTGTGLAIQASASPTSLTFAPAFVNTTSAAQTVVYTNTGSFPINITGISSNGDFGVINNCPPTLPVGETCTVLVAFAPSERGLRTGLLTITGNFTGPVPVVTLNGTGEIYQGTASPTTLSFADQQVGTTSSRQNFTLTNTGDGVLTISNISATGNFSVANGCPASLAVGSSCQVGVSFAPTALGSQPGTVALTTNATAPIVPVSLTGNGIGPMPVFSVSSLTFGPQFVGTTSPPQSVTLTNTGTMVFTNVVFSLAGDYSQTNNCGTSIAIGASCTINVTFHPSAAGTRQANMIVTGNLLGAPGPSVNFSGTGQAILATASPTSLTFAPAPLNTTSPAQTITFTNSGDTTAAIAGVLITGDFAQTNNCGTSLAMGASCSVSVTFTPSARGSRSGTVTLQGNFTSPAPIVNLSGSGQAMLASLTPATFDFGNEPVNTTSNSQLFTYTNTGDLPLSISAISVTGDFAQSNNCATTLPVAATCSITVTFTPTVAGDQSGSMTVTGAFTGSGVTAALTGTGVLAPIASVSPSTLSFASRVVNTTSGAQAVSLTNTGRAALTITSISASGDFAQTNNCGTTLAVNTTCKINVTFKPTSAGAHTGAVTIVDNSYTGSQQIVSLSGTGLDFAVSVSPSSATVTAGQYTTATVTVTALGGSYNSSVSLKCSGLPPSTTCSFSPSSVSPKSTFANSVLKISTGAGKTPPGDYTVTITGTSGSLLRSTPVSLTVN